MKWFPQYRSWAALCLFFSVNCSGPPVDPRQILVDCQDSLRDTEIVEYRFTLEPVGESPQVPMTGRVVLQRLDLSGSGFLAEFDSELRPENEPVYRLAGVKQAERIQILDHSRNLLSSGSPFSGGLALLSRMSDAFMYPFYDPESLADEIEAISVEFERSGEVEGVACDWIRVSYEDDDEDSRWCIGQQDRLPRALEWLAAGDGTSLRIFDLTFPTNPPFSPIELPEGFKEEEASMGPPPGTLIDSWSLMTVDGRQVTSEELKGEVVILDFWATWCPPCRAELLALDRLLVDFEGQPVVAFAVNAMEQLEPGDPRAFAAELELSFQVLLDGDEIHDRLAPGNLPALAVIDAQGRLTGVTTGYLGEGSDQYIRGLIERALADS